MSAVQLQFTAEFQYFILLEHEIIYVGNPYLFRCTNIISLSIQQLFQGCIYNFQRTAKKHKMHYGQHICTSVVKYAHPSIYQEQTQLNKEITYTQWEHNCSIIVQ